MSIRGDTPAAKSPTQQEVVKVVNRYISVDSGYLADFSYRTHTDF